jgi:23S rRNA pseudouridine2605 synthase
LSTIRLNKLLATRGIGARRKCDLLIESGVVRVNGEVVTAPGARVVEGRDRITVSGRPIPENAVHRYLMLHKPVGVITTLHDPEGRRNIADLIPREGRLYPVGRLDADTSGLLIITNDGELAHHLMHPRYGLTKFYRVLLAQEPTEQQLVRLAAGVEFEPGVRSAPARVRRRDPVPRGSVIEVALHEGRHRQVRRMCEAVGLTVLGLHRWAYGPLKLGELARGVWRELSEAEVTALRGASARPRPRPAGLVAPGRERARGPRGAALRPRTGPPDRERVRDERAGNRVHRERSPRGEPFIRSQRGPRPGKFVRPERGPAPEPLAAPARGPRGPRPGKFVRPERGPAREPFATPARGSRGPRPGKFARPDFGARGDRRPLGPRSARGPRNARSRTRPPVGQRRSRGPEAESFRRGAARTQRPPYQRPDERSRVSPPRSSGSRRPGAGPRGRNSGPPGRGRPARSSAPARSPRSPRSPRGPRGSARGAFRGRRRGQD